MNFDSSCYQNNSNTHCLFSSLSKPNDNIDFKQKRVFAYQSSFPPGDAIYSDEKERVRSRKLEHVDVIMIFNIKKSALSKHVLDFDLINRAGKCPNIKVGFTCI